MDVYELVFDLLQAQKVTIKTVHKGLRCYLKKTVNKLITTLLRHDWSFFYNLSSQFSPLDRGLMPTETVNCLPLFTSVYCFAKPMNVRMRSIKNI